MDDLKLQKEEALELMARSGERPLLSFAWPTGYMLITQDAYNKLSIARKKKLEVNTINRRKNNAKRH